MGKKENDGNMDCCSFCGLPRSEVEVLFGGMDGANICDKCIEHGHELLMESKPARRPARAPKIRKEELLKPAEIKAFLDQYVIGQEAAKRYM